MNQENKVVVSRSKIGGELPIVASEILDGCLYSGFFGTLDSARTKSITDTVLNLADSREALYIIIDLSNVEIIDSAVAVHLVTVAESLRLVGTDVIFCGIKPFIAQSISKAGITITNSSFSKNLNTALKEVLKRMGMEIVPIKQ
ncbi:MAG TPA: STAS domain-containing protein [Patescibacteria group bacterium]|nr:STAS domain-containing protein [Patescibacteria group bacterium]